MRNGLTKPALLGPLRASGRTGKVEQVMAFQTAAPMIKIHITITDALASEMPARPRAETP